MTSQGVEFLFKTDILRNSSEGGPQAQTITLERIPIMLFAPKEKGQGLVEYAIILALVAIVVIAVMRLLGPKIGNTFSTINSSLP
jgi:pilus assembly protein Flp/PilA